MYNYFSIISVGNYEYEKNISIYGVSSFTQRNGYYYWNLSNVSFKTMIF